MKRDLYGELLGNALNRGAPPGHFAAYIRPDESNVLRSMGGGVAPDGGQNMYNGMPAYFTGYGGGYGPDSGESFSVPSVDAPSVNFDIQSAVDQGATVAEEFAQAQANAQAQADAQAQAAANIRSGGIAAAAEQAKSQGIADILAQNAENETALADTLAGVEESMAGVPVPFGIPASFRGGPTESGFPVGASRVSGLPKGATSTPFGLMYTSPTQEAIAAQKAADKANNTLLGKALPGDRDVYQTLSGSVGTALSGVGSDLAKGAFGFVTGLSPVLAGMSLTAPDREGSISFVDALDSRPSYNDNFDMDDVSPPSTDELDSMVAALAPTDPTGDPATPAPDPSSQYATVAPDILARILANEQYGRRRMGLT
jgi:hypothetical protein